MQSKEDYWLEAVLSALDEHGIQATPDQARSLADDIRVSAENITLAFPSPENPLADEVKQLTRELAQRKDTIVCPECGGTGDFCNLRPRRPEPPELACIQCDGLGTVMR